MLSIHALSPQNEDYYLSLAREDYYLKGGEPPGIWLGRGAGIMNLVGKVEDNHLRAIFQGFDPHNGTKKLIQNAGSENRQPGWDLTFSAPKSVSVLWSASNVEIRKKIESAHEKAIRTTISYIEEEFSRSRTGKSGSESVRSRLVIAAFQHSTSRALDPQLHHHCLVLNVAVGPDAKTRTLVSKPLYENKILLGALYRAELAHLLQHELGLGLSRKRNWFEVDGIPPPLLKEQSKRRQEIAQELSRLRIDTAAAASVAALTTRKMKNAIPPREKLFESWRAIAENHGLTSEVIKFLLNRVLPPDPIEALNKSTCDALNTLTSEVSHFSEPDFLKALAESEFAIGLSLNDLRSQAASLHSLDGVVSLGKRNGEERFTTKQVLALEEELLNRASSLSQQNFKGLRDSTVEKVITQKRDFSKPPPQSDDSSIPIVRIARWLKEAYKSKTSTEQLDTLSVEQAHAVSYLTQSPGRIKVLSGLAGTSKTSTINAVREAFESEGFRVLGAALSGRAARELGTRAGIESTTIRMRELQLHPTLRHRVRHTARQLYRTARYGTNSKLERLKIDKKTVLVVDEASMVGNKDMLMLVKATEKAGGIIILVGDQHQLPSIEAGGAFGSIASRVGGVHLKEILRQRSLEDRNAVRLMPQGKTAEALAHYVERGQLRIEPSEAIFEKIISDWKSSGGVNSPAENIICTTLNRDVDYLNDLAQTARLNAIPFKVS